MVYILQKPGNEHREAHGVSHEAIDFLLWTLARTVEDMRDIEGRRKNGHELADPYLFKAVPKSIRTAT